MSEHIYVKYHTKVDGCPRFHTKNDFCLSFQFFSFLIVLIILQKKPCQRRSAYFPEHNSYYVDFVSFERYCDTAKSCFNYQYGSKVYAQELFNMLVCFRRATCYSRSHCYYYDLQEYHSWVLRSSYWYLWYFKFKFDNYFRKRNMSGLWRRRGRDSQ